MRAARISRATRSRRFAANWRCRDPAGTPADGLWVADFTYLRSWQGVVYLSFVLDIWSRRIVGWQFASHTRTSLVLDAPRMALSQRRSGADVALVRHSDHGSLLGFKGSRQHRFVEET